MPSFATNNAHIFYIVCSSEIERKKLIEHLKLDGILAVFHYISLHKSPFYKAFNDDRELIQSDFYTNQLLRLPLFYELSTKQQNQVISSILRFYNS
jgi:dTDP-4-amino-4,6-dideoxygalactose transaminase